MFKNIVTQKICFLKPTSTVYKMKIKAYDR